MLIFHENIRIGIAPQPKKIGVNDIEQLMCLPEY